MGESYKRNEIKTRQKRNPYQITNGIFHRIRTNNLTVCVETEKTLKSQSNLEKK